VLFYPNQFDLMSSIHAVIHYKSRLQQILNCIFI